MSAVLTNSREHTSDHTELLDAIDRLRSSGETVLQMISDYPPGDPADAKMATAILRHAPIGILLPSVVVRPLDTAQLSFRALMLALAPNDCLGSNVFFYLNVAPIDKLHHRNGEHPLCLALLTNGVILASPNAGYSLSAFKPWIKRLYILRCDQHGKQFRSWQCFPKPIGLVLENNLSVIERIESDVSSLIPDLPKHFIYDDDSFRNLRTLYTQDDMSSLGFSSGDECLLLRDGISVANVLYGEPLPGKKYGRSWLSLKPGSNIIDPGPEIARTIFLDLFRIYGQASRSAVFDIEHYDITLRGAFGEALAVGVRAWRTAGFYHAFGGFLRVLNLRIKEWFVDVGDYERTRPKYSLKKR